MSIGQALPHDSAPLHVTGEARYLDDLPLPQGTLHLAFGMASIARGRITALDLEAVRAAPDVVQVITAQDLRDEFGAVPDCSPSVHDEPLLSDSEVYFHGQPLFIVVARSHLAARKAARLAKVSYEELAPILSIEDALAANSRFEQGPVTWQSGDVTQAIAAAPHRLSGSFSVGGQEHFYLEGQIAAALPLDHGGMHIYSSTQHPSEIQHKVAHALHLPMAMVRVETRRMGGGFGGKESQGNALAIACALAARITGRPCKMRYDRDDDMALTGKRHDIRIDYTIGYDYDGRILGADLTHYLRCGWSQDLSLAVADRAMLHAENCYHIPNIRVTSHRLKTNMASATAYRGFGGPQGIVGAEHILDHLSFVLKKDPIELRLLNYYRDMGAPGPAQYTPYQTKVEDCIIGAMTHDLLTRADYAQRRDEIAKWNQTSPILKRGIGFSPVKFGISFTLTWLNQAGALVHIYQDGSVHLNHGGTEMGQGLNQKVAQVVAHVFGIPIEAIHITPTDTDKVPNTSATAASSGSDLNGKAAEAAALTLRQRLAEFLADKYGTHPDAVQFSNGMVQVAGEAHPFAKVVSWAYQARISLSSTGYYATPKINWDRIKGVGRPFYYFAYGVALSEVVIDTLTGENRILRTDIIHDTGTSLNPALDIGQVEGAFVQGAGWLTTEELVWDAKGRLQTHAPSTYKIPACSDRPRIFNVTLWDKPNPENAVGKSKAVGEPPFNHGISVLMALSNAVAACGDGTHYPNLNAPATAEVILAAVQRQSHG